MGQCRINLLKQAVNGDISKMSSIRLTELMPSGGNGRLLCEMDSIDRDHTYVRVVSGNALVGTFSGSIKQEEYYAQGGYVTIWKKDGVTYPQDVTVEVWPKYGLINACMSNPEDIDEYMVNLTTVRFFFAKGDISFLSRCQTLQSVIVNANSGNDDLYGNVESVGKLTSLTRFNTGAGAGIFGDVKDLADNMVSNGRTSGTLTFIGTSALLYLTYNGTVYRISEKYEDGGVMKDIFGFVISFSNSGWTLDSIINTYSPG